MPYEIIVGAAVALVALFLVVIRTNAAVVFFSVCGGSVLATQLGSEASLLSSTVIKDGDINKSVAYIALTVLPALLSAIFLRGSISSSKSFFNIFPAISVGLLLALLIIPQLPSSVSSELLQSSVWGTLQEYQPLILVGGVITSIMLLWLTHRHSHGSKRKRNKRHR